MSNISYNTRPQPIRLRLGGAADTTADCATSGEQWCELLSYGSGTANNGNLRSARQVAPKSTSGHLDLTRSFGYDAVNRLTSASEDLTSGSTPWVLYYGYDQYGNQWVTNDSSTGAVSTKSPRTSSAISAWNNRLAAATYDPAGNLTVDSDSSTASYDVEGRLTQLVGTTTTTFTYDGEGHRRAKTSGGVTTEYVYDAAGRLVAEYGGSSSASGTQYLMADHLGSTRVVANASGTVVARRDYLPFGEEIPANASFWRSSSDVANYNSSVAPAQQFTGKERDAETGLDYFGARYYSAAQGRWTTPDWSANPEPVPYAKFDDPQTLNLYAYVRNNPLSQADPDGHCCWDYIVGFAKGTANQLLDTVSYNAKNGDPGQKQLAQALKTDFRFTASGSDQQHGMEAGEKYGPDVAAVVITAGGMKGKGESLPGEAAGASKIEKIFSEVKEGGFNVTKNDKTATQEANITLTNPNEPGRRLNLRTETHSLPGSGGTPVRHVNVEKVTPRTATQPKKIENTHITQ